MRSIELVSGITLTRERKAKQAYAADRALATVQFRGEDVIFSLDARGVDGGYRSYSADAPARHTREEHCVECIELTDALP
jgi:hypothetical protein